jgi:hypothetical protein
MQSGFINSFPFDPVGMNSPKHAINEVKNGRLAMVRTQLLFLQGRSLIIDLLVRLLC